MSIVSASASTTVRSRRPGITRSLASSIENPPVRARTESGPFRSTPFHHSSYVNRSSCIKLSDPQQWAAFVGRGEGLTACSGRRSPEMRETPWAEAWGVSRKGGSVRILPGGQDGHAGGLGGLCVVTAVEIADVPT